MKLTAAHADTCLPSFWSGHHLPHIQVPVHNGMTLKELKAELQSELNNGPVMGSEAPAEDDKVWFDAARQAVVDITAKVQDEAVARWQDGKPIPDEEVRLFADLDIEEEESNGNECVYAFFVFVKEGD